MVSSSAKRGKQSFFLRLIAVRLILAAIFGVLGFRLWYLQIVEGAQYHQAAEGNRTRQLPTAPQRGRIYDRNGVALADNIPSFSILAIEEDLPEDQVERGTIFDRLCTLVDCSAVLQVNPPEVSSNTWTRVYPWLAQHSDVPYEKEEGVAELGGPFTVTLKLNDADAGWLRRQIADDAGLTYTNDLEQALLENKLPPYEPVLLQGNVPRDSALALEEHHLEFPGIMIQADPLRSYPTGALTAHLIGYIGQISPEELAQWSPTSKSGQSPKYLASDLIGKTGAELAFENLLRGQMGLREIQVDATGHMAGVPIQVVDSKPGYDVVLTLDADLQQKVTEVLQHYIDVAEETRLSYYQPIYSGVAIAMDPRDGQILAMVSLPSYDNNLFSGGISTADFRRLIEDPHHPLIDRTIGATFPPGSTFKMIVAGAALQEGTITPDTKIYDPGYFVVPNRYNASLPGLVLPCWNRAGHGWLNVVGAIQNSCDVFFYTVAGGTPQQQYEDSLGVEAIDEYAKAYGYSQPTGLGFPNELAGFLPTPEWKKETLGENWTQGDVFNMGIGQGYILATPLQVLDAGVAVANGGTRYRPQLLLRATDSQGQVVQELQPEVEEVLPVDPAYLALIRQGMRQSVTLGYNSYARSACVGIAGKTGSAEYGPYVAPGNIRQAHAWFVSFAPYEDPQLAVVVMIEGGIEGSRVSTPAATDIIKYYFCERPAKAGAGDAAGTTAPQETTP